MPRQARPEPGRVEVAFLLRGEERDPLEVAGAGRLRGRPEEPRAAAQPALPRQRVGDEGRQGLDHPPPQRRGELLVPVGQARGPVAIVAREALVAPVAVERHRDVLPGEPGDVIARDRRRVGVRLAVVPHERRDHLLRVGPDDQLVVVGAVALRHHPGVGELVESLLVEPDRERLHGPRREPAHQGDHDARIDPPAQERPERDVGHHPEADGLGQDLLEGVGRVLLVEVELRQVVERPVRADLPLADPGAVVVELDGQVVGRRELEDPPERRRGGGDVAVGQVVVDRRRVELPGDPGVLEQRLQLGGEDELAVGLGVEEGLLPHPVPRQEEAPPVRVPDGEGEHPPEPGQAVFPVLLVGVEDDLRVARRGEAVPLALQLGAELLEVIDLPVEGDPDGAVLVAHRLVAAGEVDDAQPPLPEGHAAVGVRAPLVRAPVHEPGAEPLHLGPPHAPALQVEDARDPAHPAHAPGRHALMDQMVYARPGSVASGRLGRDVRSGHDRAVRCGPLPGRGGHIPAGSPSNNKTSPAAGSNEREVRPWFPRRGTGSQGRGGIRRRRPGSSGRSGRVLWQTRTMSRSSSGRTTTAGFPPIRERSGW